MLWLTGLIGLMAVSAAAYVDVSTDDPDLEPETPETENAAERLKVVLGTGLNDDLTGSDDADRISGAGGDDLIAAAAGNDEAIGGDGNDTLSGASGDDTLIGSDGDDDLFGGDDGDTLVGQNDDDLMSGDAGDDDLNGSDGDDIALGNAGNDTLAGGLGDDILDGGTGEDVLFGGYGDDTLSGVALTPETGLQDTDDHDFLNGGGGNDQLVIGAGDDAHGGAGADQFVLGTWAAGGTEAAITDFEPEDDSLLFVWDDTVADSEAPDVRIEADPDNSGQLQVWMGDQMMAQVSGMSTLTAADISLIPLSSAQALELVTG